MFKFCGSDQQTSSGSARANEDRLALDGSIKPKIQSVKPDLILTKEHLEFGAAEHGFDDESGVGEKELNETYTKLPKTMKDLMMKLAASVDYDETTMRSLRVVGLVHSHLRMTAYVMDIPDGYVCRIRKIKEQTIPSSLSDFYNTYIPFLEVVLKVKGIVKTTMETIENYKAGKEGRNRSGYESVIPTSNMLMVPSALNMPPKTTPKKRKTGPQVEDS
ncbi:hypothetical protein BDC45DRAFT_355726 [Circinella umbellata]|nr:hypothetical protein BDC45DRAFT_355726 [Circinella umbellata]